MSLYDFFASLKLVMKDSNFKEKVQTILFIVVAETL